MVRRLAQLLEREPLQGRSTLVVDATGPGAPVVDQIRKGRPGAKLIAVTITAGEHANYTHGVNSVPKAQLISNLQIPHHGDLAMALSLAAWQQSKGGRK